MHNLGKRIWNEDEGVLSFEWVLLITLLVIGVVGGLSAARDAIIDELGDVVGALVAIDQSYTVNANPNLPNANQFSFKDQLPVCGGATDSPSRGRPDPQLTQNLTECK